MGSFHSLELPSQFKIIERKKIGVKIKPNSKENRIVKYNEKDNIYFINIKAPAVKNKANLELVKFLKKEIGKSVKIVFGMKSKEKILEIK